jgi:HEAT repeat protein
MPGTLQDVVVALQAAARQAGVYPAGHPSRAAAFQNAHSKLAGFLTGGGGLTLGVAKDALFAGEKRIEVPAARALARSLFQKQVAQLRIEEGVSTADVEVLLQSIAERPGVMPQPLQQELQAAGVKAISARAPDYAALHASTEVAAAGARPSASLWEEILRVLVEGRQLSGDAAGLAAQATGESVAALLAGGGVAGAPDSLQTLETSVAAYLSRASGPLRPAAMKQMSELLLALPPELRERLLLTALRVVAIEDADADSLRELVSRVGPNAVLHGLRRLANEGTRLSSHALRLIQTLMSSSGRLHAETRQPPNPLEAQRIAAELQTLFQDEDIDRFNPEDHQALLENAAALDPASLHTQTNDVAELGDRALSMTPAALERTLGDTLLELLGAHEERPLDAPLQQLRRLVLDAIQAGQLERATSLIEGVRALDADAQLPQATRRGLADFLAKLVGPQLLTSLLLRAQKSSAEAQKVRQLVARLGAAATGSLLEALASEQDQSRRRRLFDVIVSLGGVIVPDATRLLKDSRWYVVRNMISLLRKVGDKNSLPEVRKLSAHADLRVRLEAIKTLLAFDPKPPRELLQKAIQDPDPKLAESAVVLVGEYRIQEAKDPLLSILNAWDLFGARRSLRLKTLRALADLGDPGVLPRIGRYFGGGFPPVAQEERRAAYKSLEAYPLDARKPLLERGLRSRDPLIRELCQKLAKAPAPQPVGDQTLIPGAPPPPEQGQ